MPRRKTHEEFLKEVNELTGEEYEVLDQYVINFQKLRMKHNGGCGETFLIRPYEFLRGGRCRICKPHISKQVLENYKQSKTKS